MSRKRISDFSLLFLISVLLMLFSAVSADTVNPTSPQNNSIIFGDVFFNATVTNTQSDHNASKNELELKFLESPNVISSFNKSINTALYEDGNITAEFRTFNDSSNQPNGTSSLTLTIENKYDVDDFRNNTETDYPSVFDPVAFLGNDILVKNTYPGLFYNLSRQTQSSSVPTAARIISDATNQVFKTNNTAFNEAKHGVEFKNRTDKAGSHFGKDIDLINPSSNVSGRINAQDYIAAYDYDYNITLYNWLNGTRISSSKYSTSFKNWSSSGYPVKVYHMNVSENKYWLKANNSFGQLDLKASKGASSFNSPQISSPRISDFYAQDMSNMTGKVTYENGTAATGLKLRIRRIDNEYSVSRTPYSTAPPIKYNFTNSTGEFKFTGLPGGSKTHYLIDVVNKTHTRTSFSALDGGVKLNSSGVSNYTEFNVTDDVGNISVKLIGKDKKKLRYAFLAQKGNLTFMKPGIIPGQDYNMTVPNGTYNVMAGKFKFSGSGFPSIVTDSETVKVNKDSTTTTLEIGFPALMKINGTVTNSQSSAVDDAQIIVKNSSERLHYNTRTNSNGYYSIEVQNSTNYTLKVLPEFGSSLGKNETTISVTGNLTKDFQLSEGPYIEGWINDSSGNSLSGVNLDAWNGSEDSYGSNVSLDNGYYKIGGLEKDTNYSIFASTPGFPNKRIKLNLTGTSETRNITFQKNQYNLDISVKDTSSSDLDAEVKVFNEDTAKRTTKSVTGSSTFSNLNQGFYRVQVEPDNSSYMGEREYIFVSENSNIDFELSVFKGLSGKVQDSSNNNISGVYVYAYNHTAESYDSDVTDSEGDFQLALSSVGHNVDLWPERGSSYKFNQTSITASEVGGSTVFNVTSGKSLEGYVKDSNGNNLNGYISVYNGSKNAYGYDEIQNGYYNITGLKDNQYRAYINIESTKYSSKTFTVGKSNLSGQRNFTFGENSGPKLWVKVNDSTGSVIENVSVIAGGVEKKTDSNGLAKFGKKVNNQQIRVTAYKKNYNSSSKTVTPKSQVQTGFGSTAVNIKNVSFTLENIRGELNDYVVNVTDSNENVNGASIVARYGKDSTPITSSAITGSDGSATLEDILPGDYLISISADGEFASATRALNLTNVGTNFSIGNYSLGVEAEE